MSHIVPELSSGPLSWILPSLFLRKEKQSYQRTWFSMISAGGLLPTSLQFCNTHQALYVPGSHRLCLWFFCSDPKLLSTSNPRLFSLWKLLFLPMSQMKFSHSYHWTPCLLEYWSQLASSCLILFFFLNQYSTTPAPPSPDWKLKEDVFTESPTMIKCLTLNRYSVCIYGVNESLTIAHLKLTSQKAC